jgi:hypothetical protein
MLWHRWVVAALFVAVAAGAMPPASRAAVDPPPVIDGLVSIDPSPYTTTAQVTLRLKPPTNSDGIVRVSNDGEQWVERPWAGTIPWSLVDPSAGGVDEDGAKTVVVEYGNGSAWSARGVATTVLDRVVPVLEDPAFTIDSRMWRGTYTHASMPDWPASTRVSLDGVAWGAWGPGTNIDLFPLAGLGAWTAGDRTLWIQARDAAGNESAPVAGPTDLQTPQYMGWSSGPLEVRFEFPRLPIANQPFTIKPVYPDGYVLPSDAWCEWVLHWGDDASIMGLPNPTWGEIIVERAASRGVCNGWTLSLPYTVSRQFHWTFQLARKDPGQDWGYAREGLFTSSNTETQIFRAADGGTDPRILTSSFPIAYVLPESTVTQLGDPVTYRLHVTGTTTVPQTGSFWTYPLNCYLNPHWSQVGGTTFTYTPNCHGPWVTGWTGTMLGGYMRSQYDPLVDGRAPKVVAPKVALRSAGFGTSAPATISWSATDSGSGVYRYQLQVSRNGGTWSSITLPTRLTKSITKSLSLSGTYRFRVRARDRVGNWSAWVAGPTVSARVIQESSTSVRWSSGWTSVSSSQFSGGGARAASRTSAWSRLVTTARSVAWVTRFGPGRGLAQVYVDGKLVTTVDLGGATLSSRRVAFSRSWTGSATRTIEIRVLGTVGRPLVEVDAFLVVR